MLSFRGRVILRVERHWSLMEYWCFICCSCKMPNQAHLLAYDQKKSIQKVSTKSSQVELF